MKDFKEALGDGSHVSAITDLKKQVVEFSKSFDVVGFDVSAMKYQ